MKINPWESREWFLLGGAAAGAILAMISGPHILAGVASGIVLGLLFAPRPGREVRRDIADWARSLRAQEDETEVPY